VSFVRKNAWTLGLIALFVVLLGVTRLIQPSFGVSGLESLARAALPFAFATAAMTVVVIVGGIDLSVASMMAVCSVTAAVLMQTMGGVPAILITLAVGTLMGLLNGVLIVITRVPDIVVTLAMLFVWEGVALLILNTPGGTATAFLRESIVGSVLIDGLPRALIVMAIIVAVIWVPLRRSKLGLAIYATGSDENAAFRSGVAVGRTEGCGLRRLRAVLRLRGPQPAGPDRYRGARSRALPAGRRRGGGAGRCRPRRGDRRHPRPDHRGLHPQDHPHDPDAGRRGPQRDHHRGGHDHGRRGDVRRLPDDAREGPDMSDIHPQAETEVRPLVRLGRFLKDNPVIPLIGLLLILIGVLEVMRPGIISPFWAGNTIKFAIPLAMLAACQVLTMLTGGIDLSAGIVATCAAFVAATLTPLIGAAPAMLVAMAVGAIVGLVNGFGAGIARVHPLIMTLGTGLIATGCLQVYQRYVIATGTDIPGVLEWLGTGRTAGLPNGLFLFVPFAVFVLWLMRYTGFGRLLFALGSNEKAAKLSGVRSWQVLMALYVLSGLIAALTGLLYLGMIRAPSLSLANPLMLPSVAAAVIGGTSIFGGRGSFAGAIVGALILRVIETMLTLARMPEGARIALFGLIILAVTALYVRFTEQR
jgi:ribose transport system permease protein